MPHPNKVKHVIVIVLKTRNHSFPQALVSIMESLNRLPVEMIEKRSNVDTF